ncbi:MAG: DUF2293 domain-containing protein [Gemmataceae bacterium]|nr:DUF2293 domain-containing protein [Gemmataceae bacterium]
MTVKEPTTPRQSSRLEEITFWGKRPAERAIPPGYACLYPGNTFVTRRARQLAAERGVKVFTQMKKSGRFTRAAAYYVPTDLLAAVEAEARATEAERAEKRVAGQKARAKAHVRELAQAAGLIRRLFPAIPAGEAEQVAVHAYEVGSGRVGRARSLSAEQKVIFAVRAHVRHEHTDYDDLLRDGWDKDYARERVAGQIDAVLVRWAGGTERAGEA